MTSLRWDDVHHLFDPEVMGALPDCRLDGTSVDDWQALFDLVRSSDWPWASTDGLHPVALPTAEAVFARLADAPFVDLRVEFADGAVAIFRPYSAESIDFDVDLRALQGQARLDLLCDFFAVLARALRRSVWICGEGDTHPVLGFDVTVDRMIVVDDYRERL